MSSVKDTLLIVIALVVIASLRVLEYFTPRNFLLVFIPWVVVLFSEHRVEWPFVLITQVCLLLLLGNRREL